MPSVIDLVLLNYPGRVSAQPVPLELVLSAEGAGKTRVLNELRVVTSSSPSLRAGVEMKVARTAAAFGLTARLIQESSPLALPATVCTRVAGPLARVGNWLAASRASAEELGRLAVLQGEMSPAIGAIASTDDQNRHLLG